MVNLCWVKVYKVDPIAPGSSKIQSGRTEPDPNVPPTFVTLGLADGPFDFVPGLDDLISDGYAVELRQFVGTEAEALAWRETEPAQEWLSDSVASLLVRLTI